MYVVQGLTEGFKIDFKGSVDSFEASNPMSANRQPDKVEAKLKVGLHNKRIVGPFS